MRGKQGWIGKGGSAEGTAGWWEGGEHGGGKVQEQLSCQPGRRACSQQALPGVGWETGHFQQRGRHRPKHGGVSRLAGCRIRVGVREVDGGGRGQAMHGEALPCPALNTQQHEPHPGACQKCRVSGPTHTS